MIQRIIAAVLRQLATLATAYAKAHLGAIASALLVAYTDQSKNGGHVPPEDWKLILSAAGLSWLVVSLTANTKKAAVAAPLATPAPVAAPQTPTEAPTPVFVGTIPPVGQ